MRLFVLLLALLIPVKATDHGEPLTCFHCGDEAQQGELPCDSLPPEPAPCPQDNYCLKILFQNGSALRGCTTRKTAWGRRVLVGCVEPGRRDTGVLRYCACATHLCNAAPTHRHTLLLLLITSSSHIMTNTRR